MVLEDTVEVTVEDTVATVGGGQVVASSTSSSPPPPLQCMQPGLARLVTPLVEEAEDTSQQADQAPVEARASQHLTAHPGPASGVGQDLPAVAGAGEELTT